MSRASRIIERLEVLKTDGVIVDYVRMGSKWLIHLDGQKDPYLNHKQVDAFLAGARAAQQK